MLRTACLYGVQCVTDEDTELQSETNTQTNGVIMTAKINRIRVFHKAFENEIKHVATLKRPTNKTFNGVLEYVYKRTQNMHESWTADGVGFTMHPSIATRSTSCGDIFEILTTDNKSSYYVVMGQGFKKITNDTYGEILKLKDDDLSIYFMKCHRNKDVTHI